MSEVAPVPSAPPTAIRWTEPQRRAIELRDGNVVVSASAGSGKTAVLSERVVRLVSEPDPATGQPPARMGELLIITFTDKATRQMRERIERDLRRRLAALQEAESAAAPEAADSLTHEDLLRDALDQLPEAWIMTIDAFCRRVVVEHFHVLGIAPNTYVPDPVELAEQERRLIRELIEQRLGEGSNGVETLLATVAPEDLVAQIITFLGFLHSLDRPEAWARTVTARLKTTLATTDYGALPEAFSAAVPFARSAGELADALLRLADQAASYQGDAQVIEGWRAIAHSLPQRAAGVIFRPSAWDAWNAEHGEHLAKLANKGVCGAALYANEEFKEKLAKPFQTRFGRWRTRWLGLGEATLLRGAHLAAQRGLALLDLALAAEDDIARLKQRRGWSTFADFERNAYRLLAGEPSTDAADAEAPRPTAIAQSYRELFRFVLVDEYQDTSPLQHALVRCVSREDEGRAGNLFIVGDVKQSIYRFRHAEPALFMEQIAQARAGSSTHGGPIHEVRLLENFRSRPELLHGINAFFRHLMDPAVGEIDYGHEEALVPGRSADGTSDPLCMEMIWLPKEPPPPGSGDDADSDASDDGAEPSGTDDDTTLLSGIAAQAAWVAQRIRAWTDPATGLLLPDEEQPATPEAPAPHRIARPGDCAILLRSLKGELEAWLQALRREGLTVRAPGLNPLFVSAELIDLTLALRAADNPLEDFTLAALMRSPLFGFSDDDLLRLRLAAGRGVPYHVAVWAAANRPLPHAPDEAVPSPPVHTSPMLTPELRARLATLFDCLDRWRAVARTQPVEQVLNTILHDTAYEAWLMAHSDAATRLENVDFLRSLMRRLADTEPGTDALTHLLELIERAREHGSDLGDLPESVVDAGAAVNLLTIHKSKGLEFPIVFLPRLERAFHTRGGDALAFDLQAGLALPGIDGAQRRSYPTLAVHTLASLRERKERSEELRLLYVAMTRARERLVLLGQVEDPEEQVVAWAAAIPNDGQPLPAFERLHARAPAHLLGPIGEWISQQPEFAASFRRTVCDLPRSRADEPDGFPGLRRALAEPDAQVAPDLLDAELDHLHHVFAGTAALPADVPPTPRLLPRVDPAAPLTLLQGKTSVTALKQARLLARMRHAGPDAAPIMRDAIAGDLPRDAADEQRRFVEEPMRPPALSATGFASMAPRFAAVRGEALTRVAGNVLGTLTHRILALLDLSSSLDEADIRSQATQLARSGVLGPEFIDPAALAAVDFVALAWFFTCEIGRAMRERPGSVSRELKFTDRRGLGDFIPGGRAQWPREFVLVQGIIDVVIDHGDTAQVIDYKTDVLHAGTSVEQIVERYRDQVTQYAFALQRMWELRRADAHLVLLGARQVIAVEP